MINSGWEFAFCNRHPYDIVCIGGGVHSVTQECTSSIDSTLFAVQRYWVNASVLGAVSPSPRRGPSNTIIVAEPKKELVVVGSGVLRDGIPNAIDVVRGVYFDMR